MKSLTIGRKAWLSLSPEERLDLKKVKAARDRATRAKRKKSRKRFKVSY